MFQTSMPACDATPQRQAVRHLPRYPEQPKVQPPRQHRRRTLICTRTPGSAAEMGQSSGGGDARRSEGQTRYGPLARSSRQTRQRFARRWDNIEGKRRCRCESRPAPPPSIPPPPPRLSVMATPHAMKISTKTKTLLIICSRASLYRSCDTACGERHHRHSADRPRDHEHTRLRATRMPRQQGHGLPVVAPPLV